MPYREDEGPTACGCMERLYELAEAQRAIDEACTAVSAQLTRRVNELIVQVSSLEAWCHELDLQLIALPRTP